SGVLPDTYRPSGFFRVTTVLLFAVALAGAALLAWLYQLLMRWIPFIYVNGVICGGFALAIGGASVIALRWGHCRNRPLALVLTLALAGGALAASYGWEYRGVLAAVAENNPGVAMQDIQHELTFRRFLELKQEAGWSLSSHGASGSKFNGPWV